MSKSRTAVNLDLGLAGEAAALIQRRKIHEREHNRPLRPADIRTGQKHDCARRIDGPPHRFAQPVRPGVGEKPENRTLAEAVELSDMRALVVLARRRSRRSARRQRQRDAGDGQCQAGRGIDCPRTRKTTRQVVRSRARPQGALCPWTSQSPAPKPSQSCRQRRRTFPRTRIRGRKPTRGSNLNERGKG